MVSKGREILGRGGVSPPKLMLFFRPTLVLGPAAEASVFAPSPSA